MAQSVRCGDDVSRETSPQFAQLGPELRERVEPYVQLLQRWNRTINLVADATVDAVLTRHVCDSLQLAPLMAAARGPAIDLGAGAGFPGLMLSLVRPNAFILIEADGRKASFLQEAAYLLRSTNVTVVHGRAERYAVTAAAHVVMARALARLPHLLALAHPLLAPGGIGLFPKGRTAAAELAVAGRSWTMQVQHVRSVTDSDATILRCSSIQPRLPT